MNFILAADEHWAIGNRGGLLVHLPGDMKFFRRTTRGSRGVTVTRWLPGRCFSAAARRCRMPIARAVSGAGIPARSWASRDGVRR